MPITQHPHKPPGWGDVIASLVALLVPVLLILAIVALLT
jgi:hypothetical protein